MNDADPGNPPRARPAAAGRTAWTLYAALLLALGFGRTIERIVTDHGGFQSRFWPSFGPAVVALGVLGHAWSLRLGPRAIWRAVFAVACVAPLGLLAFEVVVIVYDDAPLFVHAWIIGGAVLLIPAPVALYRYAFGAVSPRRSP